VTGDAGKSLGTGKWSVRLARLVLRVRPGALEWSTDVTSAWLYRPVKIGLKSLEDAGDSREEWPVLVIPARLPANVEGGPGPRRAVISARQPHAAAYCCGLSVPSPPFELSSAAPVRSWAARPAHGISGLRPDGRLAGSSPVWDVKVLHKALPPHPADASLDHPSVWVLSALPSST